MLFRKRLRKSSTGSGSGSTERTSDEQPPSETTLSSPCMALGTVIKPDPGGFSSDSNTPQRSKPHSSDSDVPRGSSHDSADSEPQQQITLVSKNNPLNIVFFFRTVFLFLTANFYLKSNYNLSMFIF